MSESQPTLYGKPETTQAKITDAQLATRWAREAANEDRLDLASALYRIAAQAARMESVYPERELAIRPDNAEEAARVGLISRTRAEQLIDSTRVVPLIGATRAEEPRSVAPAPCAVCGCVVRWDPSIRDVAWRHLDSMLDGNHDAQPGRAESQTSEQPRSHAPTSCAQCGETIRWNPGRIGDDGVPPVRAGWYHLDSAMLGHEARPQP